MNQSELFILALLIIFAVPILLWRIINKDNFAPLLIIQIITGIVLGPGLVGHWIPDLYSTIFNKSTIDSLNGVAWWGVCLFIFLAGIELNIKQTIQNKRETLITAGLALGSPLILGMIFSLCLITWGDWVGDRAQTWQFILGVGMATSVTALPVLTMFMQKLDITSKPLGQKVLAYASLDDIAIWGVLTIIVMEWQRLGYQVLFLTGFCVCAWMIRTIISKLHTSDRIYLALIWLLICALLADMSGLHYTVGAFLAGAVLEKEMFKDINFEHLGYSVTLVMMPVFFLVTGLKTNWDIGGWVILITAMVLVFVQLTGKHLGVRLAGYFLKWDSTQISLVGWLLQTKGLIEIIFAGILLDKGIITNQMFTVLLLMAITSTALTIPMVSSKLRQQNEIPHE